MLIAVRSDQPVAEGVKLLAMCCSIARRRLAPAQSRE
jgi:hypothetical protein